MFFIGKILLNCTISVIMTLHLYHCFLAQIPTNAGATREREQGIKKIGTAKRWQRNSSEEIKGTYVLTISIEIQCVFCDDILSFIC